MKKKSYVRFIARELTSVFVAVYAVLMIFQVRALRQGPEAWDALVAWFQTPLSITLHIIILAAVLFHSITWFKLAPKAMVLRVGGKPIPGKAIVAVNFLVWAACTLAIAWLILGG